MHIQNKPFGSHVAGAAVFRVHGGVQDFYVLSCAPSLRSCRCVCYAAILFLGRGKMVDGVRGGRCVPRRTAKPVGKLRKQNLSASETVQGTLFRIAHSPSPLCSGLDGGRCGWRGEVCRQAAACGWPRKTNRELVRIFLAVSVRYSQH